MIEQDDAKKVVEVVGNNLIDVAHDSNNFVKLPDSFWVYFARDRGFSVSIPQVGNHVGRHCGKISSKQKRELPQENMHMACRSEHYQCIRDGRCVVCNEENGWGRSALVCASR